MSSVSRWGDTDLAGTQRWSEWTPDAELRMEWLAQAGNELHGAGTHWVERELRGWSEDRIGALCRLHEIRAVYRFRSDAMGYPRGVTAWLADLPETRQAVAAFVRASQDGLPHTVHWLERREAVHPRSLSAVVQVVSSAGFQPGGAPGDCESSTAVDAE
ncbi:MAG: hypothetical protein EOO27_38350 [Comamonadaceae bacterium]|nr:MAG: hypothetical protein EOO27_38350 [Comamonadaceae bacterium]